MEMQNIELAGAPYVPVFSSQEQFLQRYGIDELVEEGRRAWKAAAASLAPWGDAPSATWITATN